MLSRYRAFSLIELLIVIAIVALLMSILLPALREARRAARLTVCQSQLQQFGRAHHEYTGDFREYLASFNGTDNEIYPGAYASWPEIQEQAYLILKNYSIINTNNVNKFENVQHSVYPFEQFSHFVLIEYLGGRLPMSVANCPEDIARQTWSKYPHTIDSSPFRPTKSIHVPNMLWFPFSSSFQLAPAAIRHEGKQWARRGNLYTQKYFHDQYDGKAAHYGKMKLNDLVFPAQKVMLMDSQQRHYGNDLFFAYPQARQSLLFGDGAVSVRRTELSNKGWNPELNTAAPMFMVYQPDPGFESKYFGKFAPTLAAYYRWTRDGLRGIDFGGDEVSTNW